MKVLVDTSVWSLALRRKQGVAPQSASLSELVERGEVEMIGPIRQELLSGVSEPKQFETLKVRLDAFEDIALEQHHFEKAAEFHNKCRKHGVQGSHTDFLICAVASLEGATIFTTDKDFSSYSKWIPVSLYEPT